MHPHSLGSSESDSEDDYYSSSSEDIIEEAGTRISSRQVVSKVYSYQKNRIIVKENHSVFLVGFTYEDMTFDGEFGLKTTNTAPGLTKQHGNWLCPSDILSPKEKASGTSIERLPWSIFKQPRNYYGMSFSQRAEYLRNLRVEYESGRMDGSEVAKLVMGKPEKKMSVTKDVINYEPGDVQKTINIDSILWTGKISLRIYMKEH